MHISLIYSAQLQGGLERGRHENEMDGGEGKISEGGENEGVREALAVWDQLLQQSQTTCLSGKSVCLQNFCKPLLSQLLWKHFTRYFMNPSRNSPH